MRSACLILTTGIATLALVNTASAQTPLFVQCPAVGFSTGCSFLFTASPDGSVTLASDPGQTPSDGSDDVVVGVLNDSTNVLNSLTVFGPSAFAFDSDASYDNFGAVSFTNISFNLGAGTVGFNGYFDSSFNFFPSVGIPPGGSTYFILENQPVGVTPEPGSLTLMAIGVGILFSLFRGRRRGFGVASPR